MSLFLTVEVIIVFLATALLLNKYVDVRKQRLLVTVSVFVGWFFSFVIIFVLPLDVSITFYKRCLLDHHNSTETECEKPGGYVDDQVLMTLWRVAYWTAQALTWIILPLMQSFVNAGDFTTSGRLKSALYNNAIYYGIYFLIFVFLLIYAIFKGVDMNAANLKVILVSASNSWGLFLLVVLLGYGLVELPRSMWNMGSRAYRLNRIYFNIDKLSSDKHEAEDNLKDCYREARAVSNLLKNEFGVKEKAQMIVSRFPEEVIDELFPGRAGMEFSNHVGADLRTVNTDKYLIRLHKRAIAAVQAHRRMDAQWKSLMMEAMFLEEAVTGGNLSMFSTRGFMPRELLVFWHTTAQRPFCKVLSIVLAVMTAFILLSECTFFIVHPTLSPAAIVIDGAATRFHYKYTQLVAIAIICFVCSCAYFTIFRLKIYKYYHLDPNRHTDENSLLFSAMLLCRLTPPICLNFLGMIHLDNHITLVKNSGIETQFTKLMGHLDIIPLLAKGINIYLPISILLLCALTYFRLGTYILHSLGFDQFVADDEFTNDMVQAGRSLVNLERNSIRRSLDRTARQSNFRSPTAGGGSSTTRRGETYRRLPEDIQPIIGQEDEYEEDLLFGSDHPEYSSRRPAPMSSASTGASYSNSSFGLPESVALTAPDSPPSRRANTIGAGQSYPLPQNIFDDM